MDHDLEWKGLAHDRVAPAPAAAAMTASHEACQQGHEAEDGGDKEYSRDSRNHANDQRRPEAAKVAPAAADCRNTL